MHSNRTPWRRLLFSLLITLALVVPVSYLVSPWVYRQMRVGWLTSDNLSNRQRGLSFVAANAHKDGGLRAGAVRALRVEDNTNFLQIVDALQSADCWNRNYIPDHPWLHWIELQTHEPGIEAPARAAQRLADLQDLADNPRLIMLLLKLSNHVDPDVRYNALCSTAELFTSANDKPPYHDLITDSLNDPDPVIAHHAKLFAYLTGITEIDQPAWLNTSQNDSADTHYDKTAIMALLHSPDAPLRDVGCVLAARDLDQSDLMNLIHDLLSDASNETKMTGAILAGISGLDSDVLKKQISLQTNWVTASVMKLGLWMHNDTLSDEVQPEALLAHGDVSRTTVILAMLHNHDPRALEVLLNPRGEAPDDLAYLIEGYGWFHVLDQYLPDDAPRWQSHTDPTTQQLQIDLLRDWYLVNRHRLMNRGTIRDKDDADTS